MKWWNDLTKEEQQQYLLDHPKSKLKVKGKDSPDFGEKEPLLSDEELDALTKQVDTSLEDDEDYQKNKKIVGNYVNNTDNDKDTGDDEEKSDKAAFAGACLCFMTALALATIMPDHAATIFASAYMVGDIYVQAVRDRNFGENKKQKTSTKNDAYVELLPEEEDAADERKRNLVREINTDENGEYIGDTYKPEDSTKHLVTLLTSNLVGKG